MALILALMGLTAMALPLRAESLFACSQIENSPILPTVESDDAVFFRTQSDLRMAHPMKEAVVDQLARLSQALARNGTILIYATIPSKSQGMPDALPEKASGMGYDPAVSEAAYHDIINRLNAKGILAPDLLTALQQGGTPERPFQAADFHWTSSGALLAARAIGAAIRAHPAYADLTPGTYTSTPLEKVDAFSTMRRILQGYCVVALPPVETLAWETVRVDQPGDGGTLDIGLGAGDQGETLDIFADGAAPLPVVLVGTSFSDNDVDNFAGFLSEYSGLEVVNHAISGGNQFGAITSYLTSTDYPTDRPRFLIWENPVYNNLGRYGFAPLEELIAAANNDCEHPLPLRREGNALIADLRQTDITPGDALLADFGAEGPRSVQFTLQGANGVSRSAMMKREDRLRATGRFFLGLGPYLRADLQQVQVAFDRPLTADSRISLCLTPKEDPS
ncbi:alginate biosynthesis protein AlgX [Gemmobacter tilapiae]|uniref:Alginate biosynthesis protein AlgX n=1 Tax=Neogemmobacter tilapiae TaxID=875041 RepID=A0A918TPF0_9RHOB|nr:alginate biosynthesis protein AlgX [Gemmobacter tilapiae]